MRRTNTPSGGTASALLVVSQLAGTAPPDGFIVAVSGRGPKFNQIAIGGGDQMASGAGVGTMTTVRNGHFQSMVMPRWHTRRTFLSGPLHVPSSETRLELETRVPRRSRRGQRRGCKSSKESGGDVRGSWVRTVRRRPTSPPTPAYLAQPPVGEPGTPWPDLCRSRPGDSRVPWRIGGLRLRRGHAKRSAAAWLFPWVYDTRFSVSRQQLRRAVAMLETPRRTDAPAQEYSDRGVLYGTNLQAAAASPH